MKKRILSLATVLFIGGAVVLTSCKKDTEAPVITLKGDAITKIELGSTYADAGVTADDNEDGDVSANVTNDAETAINNKKTGKYTVTYSVADKKGNEATETREVWVVIKPSTLVGNYDCVITEAPSLSGSSFSYTDNVTTSAVSSIRGVTNKFAGYSNAGVYFELSGDLGQTVTIPSQSYVSGTNNTNRTFSGNGTVSEDGQKITFNYTEVANTTETGKIVYTKK